MQKNPFDLTGKVAAVTGGGTGIGRASALLYARHGADVILAGRHEKTLEETAQAVRALGRKAEVVVTDVREPEACERFIAAVVTRLGQLDILLNNAGGSRVKQLDTWSIKDFNDMIALNLTSVWVLSLAAARVMRMRGGAIVNVSSAASLRPFPHSAPYGVAKAGVNNMTAVLAVDLAGFGIRVNAVAPGTTKSEGFLRSMATLHMDPDTVGSSVTGRSGNLDELAWPILFLSSEAASFITGQTLLVSGAPAGWAPSGGGVPTSAPKAI
jgi:NAD(P)-dependent dehydrogenase (short-subunit alcohol dehydrogenase family)